MRFFCVCEFNSWVGYAKVEVSFGVLNCFRLCVIDAVLVVAVVKIYYVLEFLWKFLIKGTVFFYHFYFSYWKQFQLECERTWWKTNGLCSCLHLKALWKLCINNTRAIFWLGDHIFNFFVFWFQGKLFVSIMKLIINKCNEIYCAYEYSHFPGINNMFKPALVLVF